MRPIVHDSNAAHGSTSFISGWKEKLKADPYRSYLYSYPHKTAYRQLEPALPLADLWAKEPADTYFLYMHIPFCGARCGFCNLFTLPDGRTSVHEQYIDALERQAKQWAPIVGGKPFARFALGGGTPTLLAPNQLERLFLIAQNVMGLNPELASISVETSPDTVTAERLDILSKYRVDRVSMGIQSFVEAEANAVYRPQKPDEVERALQLLETYRFPVLNLDLIYGLPGQTVDSWLYSVDRALAYAPQELFIYPLYTREHTIVKPRDVTRSGEDIRLTCYEAARERLRAAGYVQYSMRRFAKPDVGGSKELLPYGCQEEGMVGLGCGARSYTHAVHYASPYGVSRRATASIISDYVHAEDHTKAEYGYVLSESEQSRRYVLKGILHREGLDLAAYRDRFTAEALEVHAELELLLQTGLAELQQGVYRLTDEGLAYSDAIGDWLISPEVRERMEAYELR